MATLLRKGYEAYQYVFVELTDPRTEPWLLVGRPYQGLTLLAIYLLFVLKWGPKFMKNRPAYDLKLVMIIYNVIQMICCGYIFVNAIWHVWGWTYKWICEPVDFSNTEEAIRVAKFVHYYFLLKVVDLMDTVFFVLRKKFNHISFLHVYHHAGMVMLTWASTTYYPGGHGTMIGTINSFVHVVMYWYYLMTVAFPSMKNSLWWKKYITQLQIIQFACCTVHMAAIVFKPDCAYPRWTAAVFLPQNLFMLILFIDFYIKTYIKKPKAVVSQDEPLVKNTKETTINSTHNDLKQE